MLRQTAYQTSACAGFITSKIQNALEEIRTRGDYLRPRDIESPHKFEKAQAVHLLGFVYATTPVPAFIHPMVLPRKDENESLCVFADIRSTGSYDKNQHQFTLRNKYEYMMSVLYAGLQEFWTLDNPTILLGLSHLPMAAFSRWLSENIVRRFGLTPQDQMTISVLAAYFYICNFTTEKFNDSELRRYVGMIARATFVNGETILGIIEKHERLENIDDFCLAAREETGNVRLDELNKGLLISIVGSTWFGNSKELLAVALEFPPAWLTILYAAYTDKTYKNSAIAKMVERDKRPEVDSFVRGLSALFGN